MISILKVKSFFDDLMTEVNNSIPEELFTWKKGVWIYTGEASGETPKGATVFGGGIDHVEIAATESHLLKKLNGLNGIVLGVKMPDTDGKIDSVDNYSEDNNMLVFVLEKIADGILTKEMELQHYAKLQMVMKLVKEYFLESGMNALMPDDEQPTLSKPFRTEWEFNQFGGFNGLSVSFDLEDFSL